MARKKKKKSTAIVIVLCLCLIITGVVFGLRYYEQKNKEEAEQALALSYEKEIQAMPLEYQRWQKEVDVDTIYPGICVMGVDIGNCTKAEAVEKLDTFYTQQVLSKTITLSYKEKQWNFTFADLGYTADTKAIVDKAFDIYREGNIKARYEAIRTLQKDPMDLMLEDQYEESALDTILFEIKKEIDVKAENAGITRKDGKFVVEPEQIGYSLNVDAVKTAIQDQLHSGENIMLELTVQEEKPEVTEEMLSVIQDKIGSFATYYSLYDAGRNANLEVGCGKINGTVLLPGETFNYNNTVSPVDAASGYKEASTIVDGQYVPGLGGGLCQVSTTLYNAVIRAELEVTERYAHSRQPGYVVNGQDAAMSIGGKNFQFMNSSEYPVYIEMSAYNGTLSCTIYGVEEHHKSREVTFESVLVGTIEKPEPIITEDDTMDEGTEEVTSEGCEGLKYEVYKVVTEKGKTTRTYFSSSTYYPVADRITKGTKPVEDEKEKDKENEEDSDEKEESEADSETISE